MAFDSPYDEPAAKPPITKHAAFPAIVALWFAALLGLGSLVLPSALLDRLVAVTGLASLIPAAASPLGSTARAIVAIAGASVGAALGLSIARRLAGAHQRKVAQRAAEGSRRPISVHEELGGEGVVNGESLPIDNRRALAISQDAHPSDFLYHAFAPVDDEPLELSELARDYAAMKPAEAADQDFEMTANPEFPFASPSRDQHYPPEPESQIGLEAVALSAEEPEFRADWETAPLDELGLVQLVQRLGSTIERRRELMARAATAPVATAAPLAAPPADFDPAPAEEAAQAMAAYFTNPVAKVTEPIEPEPMPRPELARSSAEEEDDGDSADEVGEDSYSSLLGMSNPFAVPKDQFVRVEEPKPDPDLAEPAVVFPRHVEPATASAPQHTDADAALRAALATLQRMSGAT